MWFPQGGLSAVNDAAGVAVLLPEALRHRAPDSQGM